MKTVAYLLVVVLLATGCGKQETAPPISAPQSSPLRPASQPSSRTPTSPVTLHLASPKSVLVVGESRVLKLVIQNTSDSPVDLPWPRFVDQFIHTRVVGPDKAEWEIEHVGLALGDGKYPGGDIAPGKSIVVELSHTFDRPGNHRLTCVLHTSRKACPWWQFWEGQAQSNTIEVEVRNQQQGIIDQIESKEISMAQIDDFLSLVEKTKGNPNGLIYGGGRELFKKGFILPSGFNSKFQPFLKKTEGSVAFYSFMEIEGKYGSYWAKLEVNLTNRKVLKYDAMGFKIDPSGK